MEAMYTTAEVAHMLKVTTRTLQRWRADGQGPAWIRIGGNVRYPESDLKAFVEGARR